MAKNRKHEKTLDFQIERINPKNMPWFQRKLLQEHLERYKFVEKFIKDKIVVDLGCGTGYGCAFMADKGAKKVYGIDISLEAILFTKKNYSNKKTSFYVRDAAVTKLPKYTADTLVSFELIEHCRDYKKVLGEVKRILKPNGTFILSTPNRELSLEDNPYHFKEFNLKELKELLENFHVVKLYGQRKVSRNIGITYKKLTPFLPDKFKFFLHFRPWENYFVSPINSLSDSSYLYLIAVCKNRK